MRDYINLGPAPCEESCAQVGDPDYPGMARHECRRFIDVIRLKLGREPEGAGLGVKGFEHDYGRYYEVVCYYDDGKPEAARYALDCEEQAPETWADTKPAPQTRCRFCERRRDMHRDGLCRACWLEHAPLEP